MGKKIRIGFFLSAVSVTMVMLGLSGCVTSSSHTSRGDQIMADMFVELALEHQDNPEVAKVAQRAVDHADSSPTAFMLRSGGGMQDMSGIWGAAAMAASALIPGGGGIVYGIRKGFQKKKLEDVTKRVAELEPEEARKELEREKIK